MIIDGIGGPPFDPNAAVKARRIPHEQTLMEDSRVQSAIHDGNLFFPATLRRHAESRHHQRVLHPEEAVAEDDEDDDFHAMDSRDPMKSPLHRGVDPSGLDVARQPAAQSMEKRIWKPHRGLTLSAFRRPENSIRLTDASPLRKLESEYDLHVAGNSGVLGHGAFSTVRLAIRLCDNVQVAVKSIAKHEALRSRRLRRVHGKADQPYYLEEWEILNSLEGHKYIVNLLDVFETDEEIQLVTEYCPHGELFDAIQKKQTPLGSLRTTTKSKISESKAAAITYQILRALADVHAAGIVHRDVKPENILLAKPYDGERIHVKLCDFGVARPLVYPQDSTMPHHKSKVCVCDGEASPLTPASRSQSFSAIGSDYYAAPELALGGSYGAAVDVYSLGVTLYILLCGFPPIFGHCCNFITQESDDEASAGDPSSQEVLFPDIYWNDVSEHVKDLLRRMLHPSASLRVTARQALRDVWFSQMHPNQSPISRQRNTPPPVDLQMVRDELYKSLKTKALRRSSSRGGGVPFPALLKRPASTPKRKRSSGDSSAASLSTPSRRRRVERRSSTPALMALADLCRGVPTPSVFAAAAAAAATQQQSDDSSSEMRPAMATLSF